MQLSVAMICVVMPGLTGVVPSLSVKFQNRIWRVGGDRGSRRELVVRL